MSRNAGRQLVGICTPRGREKIQFSNYFLKYFFFAYRLDRRMNHRMRHR